jgi:hypothetical protein
VNKSARSGVQYINLCVYSGRNPGIYYSVLIVVTGIALLIKYVQITTVYSLFITIFSTLIHLPPLRFHCVGGCWDRTQDSCDYGIDCQTL